MITLGGDAELELVDSLDPFSEGIVFSVRPPKKSWKNIANLSGGEKTLSSLALVFALHHYKPTPLYVMDEIDAALDFKNVSIVANYIKERTKNAQFVIISLRNNMFELADRLVGIYLQGPQYHQVGHHRPRALRRRAWHPGARPPRRRRGKVRGPPAAGAPCRPDQRREGRRFVHGILQLKGGMACGIGVRETQSVGRPTAKGSRGEQKRKTYQKGVGMRTRAYLHGCSLKLFQQQSARVACKVTKKYCFYKGHARKRHVTI